ncbi:polyprenyl synthetase family protein [Thermobifida alba]|uniref:Polyprenyl synthetase family protein n=1 Tax=Thermobifida alba TaxID=53522 RepID=A0ABY4L325_THEAE|nr:polyprenyl synthetase family protein [Thermobifida alba]UPT22063.1 polyprenyl synthetase family protein [Thermobifida alba]
MTSTAADVRALRNRLMEQVEARLTDLLDTERKRWAEVDPRAAVPVDAVADLVAAGGKRLRPAFCVSGYLAAGGDPGDRAVVDCAAALELVHAGALIHDDVLDASDLRRGAPAVHTRYTAEHRFRGWRGEARRYGEGTAILSGDLANILADRLTQSLPARARPLWNELLTEIIIGQFLDVTVAAEGVVDPELSRWIAVCKSGRYSIHRPLLLGALVAGREDLAATFEEYGEALGEAFQLRDDLIDAFGRSEAAGKPVGLDLEQHKMTLLLALAVRRDPRVRELVDSPEWDVPALRDLLSGSGIRTEIERRIDGLVARAVAAVNQAELDEAWRGELVVMAREVAYRDR